MREFPTEIFAVLLKRVLSHRQEIESQIPIERTWEAIRERFEAVWIADASTSEQLRKRLKIAPKESGKLAGKMMMVVEAFTQIPVMVWYEEQEKCNDKVWTQDLLEVWPQKGLMIIDLGFFSFAGFDQFTAEQKFFITRIREKTS